MCLYCNDNKKVLYLIVTLKKSEHSEVDLLNKSLSLGATLGVIKITPMNREN